MFWGVVLLVCLIVTEWLAATWIVLWLYCWRCCLRRLAEFHHTEAVAPAGRYLYLYSLFTGCQGVSSLSCLTIQGRTGAEVVTKRRHQSPEWTILSHSYRLIQGEIVRPQVLLDSPHPCSTRTSWWSPPVLHSPSCKSQTKPYKHDVFWQYVHTYPRMTLWSTALATSLELRTAVATQLLFVIDFPNLKISWKSLKQPFMHYVYFWQ